MWEGWERIFLIHFMIIIILIASIPPFISFWFILTVDKCSSQGYGSRWFGQTPIQSPFWKKGSDSVSSNWHPLLYTKKTLHLDDCLFLQLKCSSLEVKVWYKSFSTLSFFQPKAKCNIKLTQCSKTELDCPHKSRRE